MKIITTLGSLMVSGLAVAGVVDGRIPEPSVLSLLIGGGVVGAIVAIRKRRK